MGGYWLWSINSSDIFVLSCLTDNSTSITKKCTNICSANIGILANICSAPRKHRER